MDGQWDNTVSSIQDILNANELLPLDLIYDESHLTQLSGKELEDLELKVIAHKENVEKSHRILETLIENANSLFKVQSQSSKGPALTTSILKNNINTATASKATTSKQKKGKSFYQSIYNSTEPIVPGSEVAYKLRQRGLELEWIQCEVTKIVSEIKFEVRDPEPDENNNPGQTYKATWKDVILLPLKSEAGSLINYPYGTKVLARYPETTTFYPAEVIGTKRDGRCRLRFEGEEEEGKETEVERRLVVPYPK